MKLLPFLEIGQIVKTHGIKGEIKIDLWCDDAKTFENLQELFFDRFGKVSRKIEKIRFNGKFAFVRFFGLDSIESVKYLVGSCVYANRESIILKDGRNFIQDLIGLKVCNYSNFEICYGEIVEVLQTGANDVYRIVDGCGIERLVPVIDDVVIKKDLENGLVYIKPLVGLFDV